jgi:hypothetical protein
MNRKPGTLLLGVLLFPVALLAEPRDRDAAALLTKIKGVRGEGAGNQEAGAAWKELVKIGPRALLPTLAAMRDNELVVNNWLRAAVDAIAETMTQNRQAMPVKELEQFIKDRKNSGVGRRLAYEWLCRVDDTASKRLLPDMLDDPASELRRDAVAAVIKRGEEQLKANNQSGGIETLRTAFAAARDVDQVDLLSQKLGKLGVKVDVSSHFGCIMRWRVIGPFDNTGGNGFATVYPPEKGIDLTKRYKGKTGDVKWSDQLARDARGLIDLNKVYDGMLKGTTAYAYAIIDSPREQKVQLRAGTKNAVKVFLNGKQVFARDEYHHTVTMLDNHIAFGTLKAGHNEILIKVCQNEQNEAWTKEWEFLLRICDELGGGVEFKVATPEQAKSDKKERR